MNDTMASALGNPHLAQSNTNLHLHDPEPNLYETAYTDANPTH